MGFINLKWYSEPEEILPEATGQAGASRQLSLRCADVHPVTCDAEWTAPSASQLVTRALDHGVRAHASILAGTRASGEEHTSRPAPRLM